MHSAPPLSPLTPSFPYSSPLSSLVLTCESPHPSPHPSLHPSFPSSLPSLIPPVPHPSPPRFSAATAMGGPPGSRAPRQGRVAGGGGGLGVGVRGAGAGEGLRSSDGGGGAGGSVGSGGGGHGNGGGKPRKTSRLLLHIRLHYRRLLLRGAVALVALLLLALLLRAALRLGGGAGGEGAAPTGRGGRGGSNRKLGAPGDGGSGEGRGDDGRGRGNSDVARGGTGHGEAAGNRGAGLVRVALDRGGVGARRGRGTDVYEASREGEIVNAWDPQYGLEIDVWDPRTHNPLNKQLYVNFGVQIRVQVAGDKDKAPSELGSEVQVAGGKDKAHYLVTMVVHHLNRSSNISLYECRQWVEYYKYAGVSHVVWYDTATDSRDSIEAAWRPYIRDGFLTLHSFRHVFPSFDPQGVASKDDQATLHFLTTHGPQTAWFVRLPVTSFLFAPGDVKPGFLDRFLREYEAHRQQASQLLLQMLHFVGPGEQRPLPALLLERFVHRTEQTRGASLQKFAQMTAVVKPDSVLRLFWHHPHHLEMSKGDTVVLPAALLRVHSFEKAVTGDGVEVPFLASSSLNGALASRLSDTSQAEPSRTTAYETDRLTLAAATRMTPAMDGQAVGERMYRRKRQRASLGGSAISDQDSEDASNAAESQGPWTWPHRSKQAAKAVSGDDVGRILFGKPSPHEEETPKQVELRSKWLEDRKPVTRSGRAAKEKAAAAARLEVEEQRKEEDVQQQRQQQQQQQRRQQQQQQQQHLQQQKDIKGQMKPHMTSRGRGKAGRGKAESLLEPERKGRRGGEIRAAATRRVLERRREEEQAECQSNSVVEVLLHKDGLNVGGSLVEGREVAGVDMARREGVVSNGGRERNVEEARGGDDRSSALESGSAGSESEESEKSEESKEGDKGDSEWGLQPHRKSSGLSVSPGKGRLKREHGKQERTVFVSEKQNYFAEVDAFELEEEEASDGG
ncbi:unnamed protein product [Closterium sp. NIES-64]|nr:unnamed protein product [Closterium sp. NIES-64]